MAEYNPYERKHGPRVAVQNNFLFGGLGVTLAMKYGEGVDIMRFTDNGRPTLHSHPRHVAIDNPTMILEEDMARELCMALMHHFKMTSLSSDREDLLEERKRSNKLMDHILGTSNTLIDLQGKAIEGFREGL